MSETQPTPPYELEPTEETTRKFRVGAIVVAIFLLVVIATGVALIVIDPVPPEANGELVPRW